MNFYFECQSLPERSKDPIYCINVSISIGNVSKSGVVIYERDGYIGKYNFGSLAGIFEHLTPVQQNAIKTQIKQSI